MINLTTEMFAQFMVIIGILVFAVTIVTEVIKNLGFMKWVPTDIVVITLSMTLTLAAFFAYAQYTGLVLMWYWTLAAIICGFFVAFIAMFGWSKVKELWDRYKFNNYEE